MTFQFSIWDKIRDLENLSATAISNLVSLLAHLLRTKSLPLSVLKVGVFSSQKYSLYLLVLWKMHFLCYLAGTSAVHDHKLRQNLFQNYQMNLTDYGNAIIWGKGNLW